MEKLSPEKSKIIEELARRYSVSSEAVRTLLQALIAGHGTMAQFSHLELGGPGQWARGGMTMIGDMFNSGLKAKVEGLCADLANLLGREPSLSQATTTPQTSGVSLSVPATSGSATAWWKSDLGLPSSTGSQNHIRYAFFPASRRLAVAIGDRVTIYDTGDHAINGVSQQQGGDASLTFVSQRGLVRVADLTEVGVKNNANAAPESQRETAAGHSVNSHVAADDVFLKLERLAELHKKGIVSDEEFAAKKSELLGRL